MPQVVGDRMACKKPAHHPGHRHPARPQQQMEMVGHQGPGIAAGLAFYQQPTQPCNKPIAVLVVIEYRSAVDAAGDDMVHCSGCIYAGFARHANRLSAGCDIDKFNS